MRFSDSACDRLYVRSICLTRLLIVAALRVATVQSSLLLHRRHGTPGCSWGDRRRSRGLFERGESERSHAQDGLGGRALALACAATASAACERVDHDDVPADHDTGPAPVCIDARAARRLHAWRPRTMVPEPTSVKTTQFSPVPSDPTLRAYAAWIRTSSTDLALYPGYKGPGPTTLSRGPEEVPRGRAKPTLGHVQLGLLRGRLGGGLLRQPACSTTRWSAASRPWCATPTARSTSPRGPAGRLRRPTSSWRARTSRSSSTAAPRRPRRRTTPSGASPWAACPRCGARPWASRPRATWSTPRRPTRRRRRSRTSWCCCTCVRAMQLDINPEWPIFVTYDHAGAVGPTLIVPNPNQIAGALPLLEHQGLLRGLPFDSPR